MKKATIIVGLIAVMSLTGCQVKSENTLPTPTVPPAIATEPVVIVPPTPTPTQAPVEPEYEITINEDEVIALAQTVWGEARGCTTMEQAAVIWCVLNRADTWNKSVLDIITAPKQFHGYSPYYPVEDELYELAVDVLTRWQMEKQGASFEEVGRVLPKEYIYFGGDGKHNYFRVEYDKFENLWDWSYPNPYELEV